MERLSRENNSTKVYRIGIRSGTYNDSGTFNFDIRNSKDTSKKVTHTIEYVSSRPNLRSSTPYDCIYYNATGDANTNLFIKDEEALYGKQELSFSINSPGGLNTPASFNSKFTLTNTHTWSITEPWDTFKLAIAGGSNTNMDGSSSGASLGSYTITFYNRLPIGHGQWAYKINNVYCIRVATYVHYQSAVSVINGMGNGWFILGWPGLRDLFNIGDWSVNREQTQYYPRFFTNVFIEGRFYNTDFYGGDECGLKISNINTTSGTALFKWVTMNKYTAESDYYAVAFHY